MKSFSKVLEKFFIFKMFLIFAEKKSTTFQQSKMPLQGKVSKFAKIKRKYFIEASKMEVKTVEVTGNIQ